MKWPWVSRHALEVAEKYAAFLEGSLQAERSRNDALQERLLSLKMTGAVEVPKPPPGPTAPVANPPSDNDLRDLIHEKAGDNPRLRRMMLTQLRRDRAARLGPDEIRRRIEDGVQSDGVPS